MLKKRIIAGIAGVVLLVVVEGASGIVADSLGLSAARQTYAYNNAGSGGGGC